MSSKWSIPAFMAANPYIFKPTDIAGLKLWLKADGITGLNDGDAISTWPDNSGNGNDAIQSGAARPLYKTGVINSKPVVRFDGLTDYFNLTTALSSVVPYTMFVVYKKRANFTSFLHLCFDDPVIASPYTWFDFNDGMGYVFTRGNTFFSVAANYFSAFVLISQISQTLSNEALWVNGASQTLTLGAGLGSSNDFNVIGKRNIDFSDGDLAELIFYDSALSTANRLYVQTYLNKKYALY